MKDNKVEYITEIKKIKSYTVDQSGVIVKVVYEDKR